jgi:hypothetical protein
MGDKGEVRVEQSTAGTPLAEVVVAQGERSLQVTVEVGDALATFGDVLLVKYAQASYGLDRVIAERLARQGSDIAGGLPLPGRSLRIAAGSVAKTEYVVFMGTPPLSRFGYDAVRTWAREGLAAASEAPGQAATVVTTVHGPEIGGGAALDEELALVWEVRGFRDALRSGEVASSLMTVRIVERDAARAKRLADGLAAATLPESDTGDVDDAELSRTVSSARVELSPDRLVTAGRLAAEIQRLHPEYAGASFGRVQIDPGAGAMRTVDDWLKLVRGLYDPTQLSASDSDLLSGRLVIAGLAMVDQPLRGTLDRAGALSALLSEMHLRPRDPSLRQEVPWTPDDPVGQHADDLGRRLVARSLADQLASFDRDHHGYSFALLIDGRWGVGKSTLLRFLVEAVAQARLKRSQAPVCVVPFDAWRQARRAMEAPWYGDPDDGRRLRRGRVNAARTLGNRDCQPGLGRGAGDCGCRLGCHTRYRSYGHGANARVGLPTARPLLR